MKQQAINASLLTLGLLMSGFSCKTANSDYPKEAVGEADALEAEAIEMDSIDSDSLGGTDMMDTPDPNQGSDDSDDSVDPVDPGDSDDYNDPTDSDVDPEY
ncbi:hypothetical protein [Pseudobacteriovorax antillogorgiicola]|uniref:Uncharacterized protein n=1 Tax=Pseudobacteriovorax antillogorgiicola TaxID=1513793 RepID=A0A1Y6BWK7_9BACT|nr:hypothetical protein [Pseudobacteriovorax antillogorgiicola]TCS50214.1 hypothetical protein EDD56_11332 [Pseudobacteriovorax antillogorgiicola]SMF32475.1 hypothetical protein SAMN06296036_11031 [Pseudobacteriovorax antillogorgiicola]